MNTNYSTARLLLSKLELHDAPFMKELVNTAGWIKFIGDRNVRTHEDAVAYVKKIITNPLIDYWVVILQQQQTPIGIISFIKRDYLEHYDIGFAFLPEYAGNGYAYEATITVLKDAINNPAHTHIFATTVKENTNSIKLLEKLGFGFNKEMETGDELLLVYSAPMQVFN